MKLFKIFLISFFFILLLGIIFLILGYRDWERSVFENKEDYICLSTKNTDDLDIDTKIENFILSDARTEFVVFTNLEILKILEQNIEMGDSLRMVDLCVFSKNGIWSLYVKYGLGRFESPWIVLDLIKDERETAEIYVRNLYIGKYEIPFGISERIKADLNRGISDALILLNENLILGRVITNIELLEDRVVLKGSGPRF